MGAAATVAAPFVPSSMSRMKSFREHQAQLAEFGRRIAEEQDVDVASTDADWIGFGAACRQALAKGRNVPLLAEFQASEAGKSPKTGSRALFADDVVSRRRRAGDAASPSLLETLRNELVECRQRLSHYARQSTELELRLEQVDREQQRAYRRSRELTEAIETEELEELRGQTMAFVLARDTPGPRQDEALAVMALYPSETIAPVELAAAMTISSGWAQKLLSQMLKRGLVRRVGYGRYSQGAANQARREEQS